LMFRVQLHFAAIPDAEILNACNRFDLPLETWRRQEPAFGSMKKVYAKRAAIRGQRPSVEWMHQIQGWQVDDNQDEYFE
jgi:hypothetical protein